jgi:putative membrane protein
MCTMVASLSALCATGLLAAPLAAQAPDTPSSQPGSTAPGQQGRDAQAGSQRADTRGGELAASDAKFMKDAAADGMAEVELGKLAAEKASSPDVKQFGQKMVDDHGKANEQLKQLASRKNVDLPTEPKPEHKAEKERLEKLSGAAFDQAYAKAMEKDHRKAVDMFSRQAKSGADAELKEWAESKVPTLKQHLAHATELSGKSGAKSGDASDRPKTDEP